MSKSRRSLRFTSEADMPESMRKLLRQQRPGSNPPAPAGPRPAPPANPPPAAAPGWVPGSPKRSKYGAQATVVDGIRFDSKREGNYYLELKARVHAGDVGYFLRQVPIHLPGNTRYVCDFLEVKPCTCGGCSCGAGVRFVDVKGMETQTFRLKKRQVEDLYPIEIEVVK